MAADDRGLWVVCEESGAVVLIDPAKNRAGPPIGVGLEPRFVTVAFGSVWVSNHLDSTIARIDPAGKVPTGIPTEFGPQVMAEADGGLWVSSVHSDSVQRIDPESRRARSTDRDGTFPRRARLPRPIAVDRDRPGSDPPTGGSRLR